MVIEAQMREPMQSTLASVEQLWVAQAGAAGSACAGRFMWPNLLPPAAFEVGKEGWVLDMFSPPCAVNRG